MKSVIFSDVSQGVNNKISPRNLIEVDSNGVHRGPFPELNNIDRSEGTFCPRSVDEKQTITGAGINAKGVLPGEIKGIFASNTLTYGDWRYNEGIATDDPNEELWLGTIAGHDLSASYNAIGRLIPYSGTYWTFEQVGKLTASSYPAQFVQLDANHILAYNGEDSKVICNYNDAYVFANDGTMCSTASVTGTAITLTDMFNDGRFNCCSRRWIGSYLSFRVSSTWYGPYEVTDVSHTHTAGNYNKYTVTLGVTTGLTAQTIDQLATGGKTGRYINVVGAKKFGVPAPERAPKVVAESAAGNLIGSYQYACTYLDVYGNESNFSTWSSIVTVNAKKVLVYDIPMAGLAGETWQTDTVIVQVNVYRRGGMMGDTPIKVHEKYIPWTRASSVIKEIGYMTSIGVNGQNLVTYDDGIHGGAWTDQTGPGVVRRATFAAAGVTGQEMVRYESLSSDNTYVNITHQYGGTAADSWSVGDALYICSYLDNTADDSLGSTIGPEDADHAMPPQAVLYALKTGNRLMVISKSYQYQMAISSTESWSYFSSQFAQTIDANNLWTGGLINIGIDTMPITGIAELQPGAIVVFKKDACYSLTGKSLPMMMVDIMRYVPGCDAPYSVAVNRYGLIWMHGTSVYWWDGNNAPLEITRPLSTFTNTTFETCTWGKIVWAHAYEDVYRLHYTKDSDTTYGMYYVEWDWRFPIALHKNDTTQRIIIPSAVTGDKVPGLYAHVSMQNPSYYTIYAPEVKATPSNYAIYGIFGTGQKRGSPDTTIDTGTVSITTPDLLVGSGEHQIRMDNYIIHGKSTMGAVAADLTLTPYHDNIAGSTSTASFAAEGAADAYQTLTDRFATDKSIFCRVPALKISGSILQLSSNRYKHNIERFAIDFTGGREVVKPRS